MVEIDKLQHLCNSKNIVLTEHARQRLIERRISVGDILQAILSGRIIRQYKDDKPLPSCLILGISLNHKPIHIVVSHDDDFIYLITAYFPNSSKWKDDYETRKQEENL